MRLLSIFVFFSVREEVQISPINKGPDFPGNSLPEQIFLNSTHCLPNSFTRIEKGYTTKIIVFVKFMSKKRKEKDRQCKEKFKASLNLEVLSSLFNGYSLFNCSREELLYMFRHHKTEQILRSCYLIVQQTKTVEMR